MVSRQAHERRPHRWIRAHCKEMHQEGKPLGLVPGPQVQLAMRVEVRPSGRNEGAAEATTSAPPQRPRTQPLRAAHILKPPALPGDIYVCRA
jgi:hypothetical protein